MELSYVGDMEVSDLVGTLSHLIGQPITPKELRRIKDLIDELEYRLVVAPLINSPGASELANELP